MSGRYLLDTNIIVHLMAGDAQLIERLAKVDEVLLSSVAVGELYYGAYKSTKVQENLLKVENIAKKNTILMVDAETARFYGQIKEALKRAGRPIPENDIWIAAIAQRYSLTLVTRDAHFQFIEGISVECW